MSEAHLDIVSVVWKSHGNAIETILFSSNLRHGNTLVAFLSLSSPDWSDASNSINGDGHRGEQNIMHRALVLSLISIIEEVAVVA